MVGHNNWVTCLQTATLKVDNTEQTLLVSGSRDKTLLTWNLFPEPKEGVVGQPCRSFTGHNHFVSDVCLSLDGNYAISSSWDKTLRLWNLKTGQTVRQFIGHKKEIFTVCFSQDNRQIISSGADKEIKLWNTLADCRYTSEQNNHQDWVSQIRYSPHLKSQAKSTFDPYFASVGWDGRLKIWNTDFQIRNTFQPHVNQINTVAISPNAKYLATGGKDKTLNFWDVTDLKEPIRSIDTQGNPTFLPNFRPNQPDSLPLKASMGMRCNRPRRLNLGPHD